MIVLVSRLLNAVLPGVALAFIVWSLLCVMPRVNAATRYAMWCITLLAVVLLPVATVPNWDWKPATPLSRAAETGQPAIAETPRVSEAAPAAPQDQRPVEMPPLTRRWATFLGFAWLVGAAVMLARLLWSSWYVWCLKRSSHALKCEHEGRFAQWTAVGNWCRVRLYSSDEVAAPMVVGLFRPAILLPAALPDQLTEVELGQIVLHELAHISRCDHWTNLASRLAEAFFFYHPAVRWIGRRLHLDREIACDDWVVALSGEPRQYAACLTKLIELTRRTTRPMLSAAAVSSRGQISRRIELLLDKTRNRAAHISRLGLSLLVMALLVALLSLSQLPAVFAVSDEDQRDSQVGVKRRAQVYTETRLAQAKLSKAKQTSQAPLQAAEAKMRKASTEKQNARWDDDQEFNFREQNGWNDFSVRARGRLEFTDDDREIKSISPAGYLLIEERRLFTARRLQVSAVGSKLERSYSVDGLSRPYEPEGRQWLGEILPRVIRETGIGAGSRVDRILRQRGPGAVLDEISRIQSNASKRVYFEELVGRQPGSEILRQAARQAARELSSDSEKARLLIAVSPAYLSTGDLASPYFKTVNSMHSDGEHRRVLMTLLKRLDLSKENLAQVLTSVTAMSSDGEKASILVEAAREYADDEAVRNTFFKAVSTLHSDGEHHRVLSALLNSDGIGNETLARIFKSAGRISSDGEKAAVLAGATGLICNDSAVRSAFFDAVATLHSDGEHRRVLVGALQNANPGKEMLIAILRSAAKISSDGEKANVLTVAAEAYSDDAATRSAFFDAVATLHSDGEHRRVLSALLARRAGNKETLIQIVKSASTIHSDGEKAAVLVSAARICPSDDAVISALLDAASTIHSDGEYRRVMSAYWYNRNIGAKAGFVRKDR